MPSLNSFYFALVGASLVQMLSSGGGVSGMPIPSVNRLRGKVKYGAGAGDELADVVGPFRPTTLCAPFPMVATARVSEPADDTVSPDVSLTAAQLRVHRSYAQSFVDAYGRPIRQTAARMTARAATTGTRLTHNIAQLRCNYALTPHSLAQFLDAEAVAVEDGGESGPAIDEAAAGSAEDQGSDSDYDDARQSGAASRGRAAGQSAAAQRHRGRGRGAASGAAGGAARGPARGAGSGAAVAQPSPSGASAGTGSGYVLDQDGVRSSGAMDLDDACAGDASDASAAGGSAAAGSAAAGSAAAGSAAAGSAAAASTLGVTDVVPAPGSSSSVAQLVSARGVGAGGTEMFFAVPRAIYNLPQHLAEYREAAISHAAGEDCKVARTRVTRIISDFLRAVEDAQLAAEAASGSDREHHERQAARFQRWLAHIRIMAEENRPTRLMRLNMEPQRGFAEPPGIKYLDELDDADAEDGDADALLLPPVASAAGVAVHSASVAPEIHQSASADARAAAAAPASASGSAEGPSRSEPAPASTAASVAPLPRGGLRQRRAQYVPDDTDDD